MVEEFDNLINVTLMRMIYLFRDSFNEVTRSHSRSSLHVCVCVHYISTGGTCSAFCNFILPAMISLKLDLQGGWLRKLGVYTIALGAFFVGAISTFFTIQNQYFPNVPSGSANTTAM